MSKELTVCPKATVVNQLIRMQAQITIEPAVRHGKPRVYCLDSQIKPDHDYRQKPGVYTKPHYGQEEAETYLESDYLWEDKSGGCYPIKEGCGKPSKKCTFILTQMLCVEIPIEFDVDVDVDERIVNCGKPAIGPCAPRYKRAHDGHEYGEIESSGDRTPEHPLHYN